MLIWLVLVLSFKHNVLFKERIYCPISDKEKAEIFRKRYFLKIPAFLP